MVAYVYSSLEINVVAVAVGVVVAFFCFPVLALNDK